MGRATPEVRDEILAHLRRTHASMCRRWFDDIEPLDLAGGTLRLLVPEPLQLKYLRKNCQGVFTDAAQAVTGMLLAVRFVGLDEAGVTEACREAAQGEVVSAANLNCPGQIVIAGAAGAVARAGEAARARGAKRVIPLRAG